MVVPIAHPWAKRRSVRSEELAGEKVLLLPEDPDASALRIATTLRASTGKRVGVILTDTLGRPWREGQTDAAIGAAEP